MRLAAAADKCRRSSKPSSTRRCWFVGLGMGLDNLLVKAGGVQRCTTWGMLDVSLKQVSSFIAALSRTIIVFVLFIVQSNNVVPTALAYLQAHYADLKVAIHTDTTAMTLESGQRFQAGLHLSGHSGARSGSRFVPGPGRQRHPRGADSGLGFAASPYDSPGMQTS